MSISSLLDPKSAEFVTTTVVVISELVFSSESIFEFFSKSSFAAS